MTYPKIVANLQDFYLKISSNILTQSPVHLQQLYMGFHTRIWLHV